MLNSTKRMGQTDSLSRVAQAPPRLFTSALLLPPDSQLPNCRVALSPLLYLIDQLRS